MSNLSLDNIITNDMNFKHLETTKDITISIKNESGYTQYPDATHTWTAKVSDGTNYVGDYSVKISQTSLIVDSEDFTALPTGSYQLEVWEEWIDPDGTKQRSIYPSPSQTIPFTIYANLTDQAEKEIKSIGFQDVVDQAVMNMWKNYVIKVNMIEPDQTATVVQSVADGKNYVTFNIPQGPKGDQGNVGPAPTLKIGTVTKLNPDQTPTANLSGGNGSYTLDMGIPQGQTGTVDNAGLTNAPAFQALQTQVNNSAVGTNLLLKTHDSFSMTGTNIDNQWQQMYALSERLEAGTTVTISFDALSTALTNFTILNNGLNGGKWQTYVLDGTVDTTKKHFIVTTTLTSFADLGVNLKLNNVPATTTVTVSNMKLELGSHATDWCPNPSEILTQSDYAKIKAAIVALGGSLS